MADMQTDTSPSRPEMIPLGLIRGMIALVAASLIIVVYARVTDRPLSAVPPVAPVVAEAQLILNANPASGAAKVFLADGSLLTEFGRNEAGFLSSVDRVIARERAKHRIAGNGPILLQSFENGRMAITDPSTGWSADLMGFGADNAAAFARLLTQAQGGNT